MLALLGEEAVSVYIYLSIYLSIYISIYLSIYIYICIYLRVHLHNQICSCKNRRQIFCSERINSVATKPDARFYNCEMCFQSRSCIGIHGDCLQPRWALCIAFIVHTPEAEKNTPKTACGCPCSGVITMVTHTINPLTIGNAFVSQCTVACIAWPPQRSVGESYKNYKNNSNNSIELIATNAISSILLQRRPLLLKIYVKIYIRSFGAANICCC